MAKICILSESPLTGFDEHFVREKCARAGLAPQDYVFATTLGSETFNTIIPLGNRMLEAVSGKRSIDKWHLSPLDSIAPQAQKVMPTFDPRRIKAEWALNLYFEMALKRAREHMHEDVWQRKETQYRLDPGFDETIATLEALLASPPPWLSIDIETGRNQINTFGVAWSGANAIAIKALPEGMSPAGFKKLWDLIGRLCESDTPKVMQNGMYERLYLSRYGILINNFTHDTMCAMKFLWPELDKGLDNVGRIYTMEPYWKDDGRVESAEGKQKDWGNIRDWNRHFDYNCKDTSNTLIAMHAQRSDLESRGLLTLYDSYLQRLFDCTYEMCTRGFPLNTETQTRLIAEYEATSAGLVAGLSKEINPRSFKQKIALLKDQGLVIPKKRKKDKEGNEKLSDSSDELTLKKMRLKYPDNTDIKNLLAVAGIEKALSSYLRVRTLDDSRIRFSLDPHGTETGRMSCNGDPWDGGFNAQTMTDYVKRMIEWKPEEDRVFLEIDLSQAESRFVAYDAVEENLLGMLERKEDIHRYVAAEIYQKPMALVTHGERQLGKKSGHGANYNMGVTTFIDSCLKEMDLVLDRKMGTRVLESYHRLFPGIRRWHGQIRNTIYRERRLSNPLGRERYFYGRLNDATYREGYAYRPQSTVPDIINHLMLRLCDQRTEGQLDFWLHIQTHDSVTLSCAPSEVERIIAFTRKPALWHPEIVLPAGRLIIPTDAKFGSCLGEMKKVS